MGAQAYNRSTHEGEAGRLLQVRGQCSELKATRPWVKTNKTKQLNEKVKVLHKRKKSYAEVAKIYNKNKFMKLWKIKKCLLQLYLKLQMCVKSAWLT